MNWISKFLLNHIGEKSITEFLVDKSKLGEDEATEHAWSLAFNKVPELRKWLNKRELILLKTLTLADRNTDFIKGQILENKLYQKMDISPVLSNLKVGGQEEVKIPDRKEFFSKWNPNEDGKEKRQEEKTKSSVNGNR